MVRFDTRETKPRLRALAVLSVAAVVIDGMRPYAAEIGLLGTEAGEAVEGAAAE